MSPSEHKRTAYRIFGISEETGRIYVQLGNYCYYFYYAGVDKDFYMILTTKQVILLDTIMSGWTMLDYEYNDVISFDFDLYRLWNTTRYKKNQKPSKAHINDLLNKSEPKLLRMVKFLRIPFIRIKWPVLVMPGM